MSDDHHCEALRNRTRALGFLEPEQRPTGSLIYRIEFAVQVAVLVGFILVFAYFKYAHPKRHFMYRIQARKLRYVVMVHFGGIVSAVAGPYFNGHSLAHGTPCYVQIIAVMCTAPLLLMPCLIRLYNFYRADELNRMLIVVIPAATAASPVSPALRDVEASAPSSLCFKRSAPVTAAADDAGSISQTSRIQRLKWQTSPSMLLALLVAVLAPYFIAAAIFIALQGADTVACFGCSVSDTGSAVAGVGAALAILAAALFIYLVRGKQDSFGVLDEIRQSIVFGGLPAVVLYVVNMAVGNAWSGGEFDFGMPLEIFFVIFCYFQSAHQCVLAVKEYRVNLQARQRYQMTPAEFTQQVVLPSGIYHHAFALHLQREHALESVSFLTAASSYEQAFADSSAATNASRARRIIHTYIGDGAVLQCNLSSDVVSELLEHEKEVKYAMFADAKQELVRMLYNDALSRFLATPAFQEIFDKQVRVVVVVAAAAPEEI